MSVWKKKSLKLLPELKGEIKRKGATVNTLFFELLPATVQAHKKNDEDKLKRYYQFAEWCLNHKEKELWNAAGVSFYEHLGDQEESRKGMVNWVSRDVYYDIRLLLEQRMDEADFKELDGFYYGSKRNLFQEAFDKNKKK